MLWRRAGSADGTCNSGLETAGRRTRAAAAAGPDALGTTATPKLLSHRSALPILNHAVPAHPRLLSITPILDSRELLITFLNISI